MWITLFSRSGSEISKLCAAARRAPDLVMTNNSDQSSWYEGVSDLSPIVLSHDEIMNVLRENAGAVVTLHGYLRIVPEDVTQLCKIYNGHPGDIINYPDLKGKDPQEKAFNKGYSKVGCVIHEVNGLVDDGKIILGTTNISVDSNLESYYNVLSIEQLKLWETFYGKYLCS